VTGGQCIPLSRLQRAAGLGLAGVASRSDDGQITFHDWHPANIQEYGIAAPDPRDPDVVFGSARTNVSRYDRRTGQTTPVGPMSRSAATALAATSRTMPIIWSPVNPSVLYYTSNVVWEVDRSRAHLTRISPDLARQTWAIPASAGRYARGVTPDAPRYNHRAVGLAAELVACCGRAPMTATSR